MAISAKESVNSSAGEFGLTLPTAAFAPYIPARYLFPPLHGEGQPAEASAKAGRVGRSGPGAPRRVGMGMVSRKPRLSRKALSRRRWAFELTPISEIGQRGGVQLSQDSSPSRPWAHPAQVHAFLVSLEPSLKGVLVI